MDDINTRVIADLDRYEQLVSAEASYDTLVQILFENSTLNWKGDELDFEDAHIRSVLKGMFPRWYATRLKQLVEEKSKPQD